MGHDSDSHTLTLDTFDIDSACVVCDPCHCHKVGRLVAVRILGGPFSGTSCIAGLSLPKHFHWTIHNGSTGSKTRQTFAVEDIEKCNS